MRFLRFYIPFIAIKFRLKVPNPKMSKKVMQRAFWMIFLVFTAPSSKNGFFRPPLQILFSEK
jgi:hypothetical protein